jgi:hypothetical protein
VAFSHDVLQSALAEANGCRRQSNSAKDARIHCHRQQPHKNGNRWASEKPHKPTMATWPGAQPNEFMCTVNDASRPLTNRTPPQPGAEPHTLERRLRHEHTKHVRHALSHSHVCNSTTTKPTQHTYTNVTVCHPRMLRRTGPHSTNHQSIEHSAPLETNMNSLTHGHS